MEKEVTVKIPQYPDEYSKTGRRKHLYRRGWYGKKGLRRKVVRELNGIQNGKCKICGKNGNNQLELDHIVKFAYGGKHEISNFQLLCTQCHDLKDNQLPH